MSQSSTLWAASRDIAQRCLHHPFVRGIGDGSLDTDRYGAFIAQDAFFLEMFARGYAHCLATAPDRDGIRAFLSLLNGTFDELELHAAAARELEIELERTVPSAATLRYTAFLEQAIVESATTGETLAAMAPCMRLYAYLGSELAREGVPTMPRYRQWLATYASPEFHELAALIGSLLDRYGQDSSREGENYRRAMELELGFFDASWGTDLHPNRDERTRNDHLDRSPLS